MSLALQTPLAEIPGITRPFDDVTLLIVVGILLVAITPTLIYSLTIGLPDVLRDRRAVHGDPDAPMTAKIFATQQVFVMIVGLICLTGFLVAALVSVSIDELILRTYVTRFALLVAGLSISALILSVSVSRKRIRGSREVVVTEPMRLRITDTHERVKHIEEEVATEEEHHARNTMADRRDQRADHRETKADERESSAIWREGVADQRERDADKRQGSADQREGEADQRQGEADQRERDTDKREREDS